MLLHWPPIFVPIRSGSGAITADSATISDVNYPLTLALQPYGPGEDLVFYWQAGGGTVLPFDSIDFQVLFRDVKASTPCWVEGPIVLGIRQNEQRRLLLYGSREICLRVVSVSCAGGTGLTVQGASAPHGRAP